MMDLAIMTGLSNIANTPSKRKVHEVPSFLIQKSSGRDDTEKDCLISRI